MEQVYSNVDYEKSVDSEPSRHQTGPRSAERKCYRAVIVILGLLSVFLLAGCIGIRVHCHGSVQASNNKLFALMQERDELKTNLTEMTEEHNKLQSLYKKKKTCPAGWKIFGCSCYFLSNKSGSWTTAQEACENKEADLVVIGSAEEQTFLLGFTNVDTWIGLTDREKENTWKWIDGSPLTVKYWGSGQPNNGGGSQKLGEEDCGHIRVQLQDWNDLFCNNTLKWICEKIL